MAVAEVENVNSVSGNLNIGPRTFSRNVGVGHEKVVFFAHKINFLASMLILLLFWSIVKKGIKSMSILLTYLYKLG